MDSLLACVCGIEQLQVLDISNLTAPDMSSSFLSISSMTNLTKVSLSFAVAAQPLEQVVVNLSSSALLGDTKPLWSMSPWLDPMQQ